MSFVSTGFVFFCALTVLIYYLVPQKAKWVVLLAASYIFYALNDFKAIIFIFSSTLASYICSIYISKITDRYIKHPSEVLSVGDIVTCYVDEVFLDKGKVALSLIKNEK